MDMNRTRILSSLLRGLLAAVLLTLLLTAGTAALVFLLRIPDGWLIALNQIMKLSGILLGVYVAIGRGGPRGFLTGMTLAMLYMALGYACYVALGGGMFSVSGMLGEILIGAAVGALFGALLSNLPPPARRRRKAA